MEENGIIWISQGHFNLPKDNFLLCYTLQANTGFIGFWLIEFHEIIREKSRKIKRNVENGLKWLKFGAAGTLNHWFRFIKFLGLEPFFRYDNVKNKIDAWETSVLYPI